MVFLRQHSIVTTDSDSSLYDWRGLWYCLRTEQGTTTGTRVH